ncbi:TPA: helix-turn-helix domain-containing protein [Vibrio fluvialis clinical-1]|uniref:helix-turn-helix domain-containing protein n=1 Tax=Vibrio aestuarianus TaxID=28171 RepID=UPI001594E046|nr:helix-turn-helix domain-containing protein [Vibrio aestuarianus]EGR0723404.1 winged helix-turn-helix transcriptional regulator [Vibrio cholerae]EKO3910346.1 helix-turn-helix domain-containing protein [Vibrio fluvialis]HDM8036036.1 helix-turn-helix domain-containing protein [Vibrio fluvialis clinical-1]MBY8147772.1 helix-turn-helix domain-containing protein [Vibrio fluvialis]MDE1236197.1 helix-turn-helix domain-containing protein [Vibrio aestuarianus]
MKDNQHSLSSYNLKPTRFALNVLEILVVNGVNGMTLNEVAEKLSLPRSTVHRYLKVLNESGWVEMVGSSNSKRWKPSNYFIKLAFNYRNSVQSEIQRIETEFKTLTNEEL